MRRGCTIAIVILVVVLALVALGLWALWVATGRGAPVCQAIGWVYEDSGSYPGAAHWYGKAVRAKPNDGHLRFTHGLALWMARDPRAALREYSEAARLEPTWTYPLQHKAYVEVHLGELEQAERTVAQLRKLAPRDAYAEATFGLLRAAQGRDAEAIKAFRQAIDLDANTPEAYAQLGKLMEKRGSTDEAIRTYEEGARRGNQECAQRLSALGHTVPPATASPAPASPAVQPPPAGTSPSASPSTSTSTSSAPPPGFPGMIAGIMVVYFIFWGFMMLLFMAGWVGQILALYDCARRDFDDPNTRAMWCLLLVLAQWIGALIYYFVIYRKGEPPIQQPRGTFVVGGP